MKEHKIIHRYPRVIEFAIWFWLIFSGAVILLILYAYWKAAQDIPAGSPFISQPEESTLIFDVLFQLVFGLAVLGLISFIVILTLRIITFYPTIITTPHGFRVIILFHKSKWLSWSAVHRIHTPLLMPGFYIITPQLPASYILNGWLQFGTKAFLISDYDTLEARLMAQRPDLFEQKKPSSKQGR